MNRDITHTPGGTKIFGAYENCRNTENADLYKAIVRAAFNVTDVIVGHHIVYVVVEKRDGFDFQIVEEIPSIDTLIFDHDIACRIWGNGFQDVLRMLVGEPAETRDVLLAGLFHNRTFCDAEDDKSRCVAF